jgi:hypothetical protein
MTLGTVLLIVLVLLMIGVFPSWQHSRGVGLWAERTSSVRRRRRGRPAGDGTDTTCSIGFSAGERQARAASPLSCD